MVRVDHLGLAPNSAEQAILTGDLHRAAAIAHALGGVPVTDDRGFACHLATGFHRPLALVGTGIGPPATAIVTEELVALGVRAIIRIGTCGTLQPEVAADHFMVASGCVRDEGTSRAYVDMAYPALADPRLAAALAETGQAAGATVHVGITHCKDASYAEKPGMLPDPKPSERRWQQLRAAGVLATEMETAALFVIASLRRIAASCIFLAVGNKRSDGFDRTLENAITASVRAFGNFAASGYLGALTPRHCTADISFLAASATASEGP